jgi:serine phosphatase RsbU (regulator of sigma subunit)
MTIQQKLISLLSVSQIIIILSLMLVFRVLIVDVKDHIQDKRLEEHIDEFNRQLNHREQTIKLLSKDLLQNPNFKNLLLSGFSNRSNLIKNNEIFKNFMKENNINILEIGDKNGIVVFRFHRPEDYGDSKINQKIIQEALAGKVSTTLEMGNSGLGFRTTTPIENYGTLLMGQTVSRDFIRNIADFNDIKMALFNGTKLLASSDDTIDEYIKDNLKQNSTIRKKYNNSFYYMTKRDYDSHGFSNLDLKFFIMVNEDSVEIFVNKIWYTFGGISVLLFLIVSFCGFHFSKDMIKAIKSLNFAMKNIEETESHTNLDLNRRDEIGEITKVFISMKEEIINHQKTLESTIEIRTSELKESLKQVTLLKEHQDGDYFLTSQLLKPLFSDDLHIENVSITSIIRQKKKFTFKRWESELGGDINIVNKIILRDKDYTVFLNADAMGKSIQGAGGALVMGTVFKSILSRNSWDKLSRDKSPERWIYDCYLDLQNVFMAFDGTMLVSAIIGIIDNLNGTVYCLNADHPRMVLYRDEVANFCFTGIYVNKLGIESPLEEFKVSVIQLESGDSLILGSDGRDDILVANQDGEILNEDENKFLQFVNESHGNLDKLEFNLLNSGKMIDDLSLMKIHFKKKDIPNLINKKEHENYLKFYAMGEIEENIKNYESALEYFEESLLCKPSDGACLKKIAKMYERLKDNEKVIDYCKKYLIENPADSNFLYIISYYSRLLNKFDESIEYGERYRLRDPLNADNLNNLLLVYQEVGNIERINRVHELLVAIK